MFLMLLAFEMSLDTTLVNTVLADNTEIPVFTFLFFLVCYLTPVLAVKQQTDTGPYISTD